MIERGKDRRRCVSSHFTQPQHDQRRGIDRRACAAPLMWPAAALPGTIRPAPGEAAPFVERRRVPESGME
jgi:hypothetical protein